MTQDIDELIRRCMTCQRHKGMTPLENQAKATSIKHIFQRICMDLVSGLSVTDNGNCIILVIVEYLTKHVSIFALKTKTAEEVAEHLWTWITRFGPPDTILNEG